MEMTTEAIAQLADAIRQQTLSQAEKNPTSITCGSCRLQSTPLLDNQCVSMVSSFGGYFRYPHTSHH